ncbi:hypothetical protein EON63_23670 [archaeon]|nr:MAG: hypothetical protein EON63_23670 [archaeon]
MHRTHHTYFHHHHPPPSSFNGTSYKVYGRKRPYLDYFLQAVSKSFEVVCVFGFMRYACML